MDRLSPEDTALYAKPRHPDFDDMWARHFKLVYWWSGKLAKVFNGNNYRYSSRDFLGYLTIRFNACLWKYDPNVSKFTTYYSSRMIIGAASMVLRYESEYNSMKKTRREMTDADSRVVDMTREFHENEYYLYRVPENNDWSDEMLDLLGGITWRDESCKNLTIQDAAWMFLMRGVSPRNQGVMEMRYRHDKTMQECANQFNITKQRIEQIESRTKRMILDKLEKLEPVRKLFFG